MPYIKLLGIIVRTVIPMERAEHIYVSVIRRINIILLNSEIKRNQRIG